MKKQEKLKLFLKSIYSPTIKVNNGENCCCDVGMRIVEINLTDQKSRLFTSLKPRHKCDEKCQLHPLVHKTNDK